jgi:PIN domain nuclease of toxin-antitoxin system
MTPQRRRRTTAVAEPPRTHAPRRVLLDTHVWLWWVVGDERLGKHARATIQHSGDVRLSIASVWEIAIKRQMGRLTLPDDFDLARGLDHDGFALLPIAIHHTEVLVGLPRVHRDPFDRMLIAQAHAEDLSIVTADATIAKYGIPVVDALR